jgi:N-acetylglucosaminyl transferase component (Gpi1)
MDARKNPSDDDASLIEPVVTEVLYWPLRHGQSKVNLNFHCHGLGFVLGWKTVQNKRYFSTTNEAHNIHPISVIRETYVVAGIIRSTIVDPHSDATHLILAECNQLLVLLNELMQKSQNLRNASSNDDDFEYRDCRTSFSIIALWNPLERTHSTVSISTPLQSKQNLLPWITFDERMGIPIIVRDTKMPRIQKQVVFYPSFGFRPQPPLGSTNNYLWMCDGILWNHGESTWQMGQQPKRSPTLVQLTHAHVFFSLIQHWLLEPSTVSCPLPQGVAAAADFTSAPTTYDKYHASCFTEWQQSAMTFCMGQSLLLRHCSVHGASMYTLVRHLFQQNHGNRLSTNGHLPSSSRYEQVQTILVQSQEFVFLLVDLLVGALLSLLIFYSLHYLSLSSIPINNLIAKGVQQHYRQLNRYIEYLELFPLGFKLNQSLLYNVGREVQRTWKIHEGVVNFVISVISKYIAQIHIRILSVLPLLFGGSGCIALVFDIIRFSTIHVSLVAWFTIRIYSFECYLLSTLFKMFCGRKRNILRHRIDTIEYDAMQLLFGTILFTMVLFLFTTVFVGHIFYTLLYLITIGAALPCSFMYIFLRHFPYAALWFRWRRPGWFAREVYLTDDLFWGESHDAEPPDITHLKYRSDTFSEILTQCVLTRLRTMLLWLCRLIFRSLIGSASSWSDFLDTVIAVSSVPLNNRCS